MARNRVLDELSVPPGSGASGGGGGGSGGVVQQSSSSNLLDISETASEAWSMDVLASDSESLRLNEFDNEDSASVASRFTDDTTRYLFSEQVLQEHDLLNNNFVAGPIRRDLPTISLRITSPVRKPPPWNNGPGSPETATTPTTPITPSRDGEVIPAAFWAPHPRRSKATKVPF